MNCLLQVGPFLNFLDEFLQKIDRTRCLKFLKKIESSHILFVG